MPKFDKFLPLFEPIQLFLSDYFFGRWRHHEDGVLD
jgi:hypothetical protein